VGFAVALYCIHHRTSFDMNLVPLHAKCFIVSRAQVVGPSFQKFTFYVAKTFELDGVHVHPRLSIYTLNTFLTLVGFVVSCCVFIEL